MIAFIPGFPLPLLFDEQLEGAAGGEILNQQATMETMHDIVTCYRGSPETEKDHHGGSCRRLRRLSIAEGGIEERVAFSPVNLTTTSGPWKPTKGTTMGLTRRRVLGMHRQLRHRRRQTETQGHGRQSHLSAGLETARFRAETAPSIPFTISLTA
jgi:hypothetical protein